MVNGCLISSLLLSLLCINHHSGSLAYLTAASGAERETKAVQKKKGLQIFPFACR
jgi:hypothetical protein